MYCGNCQNRLEQCTCKDLLSRFQRLKESPYLYFTPDQTKKIIAQGRKNLEEETKQE